MGPSPVAQETVCWVVTVGDYERDVKGVFLSQTAAMAWADGAYPVVDEEKRAWLLRQYKPGSEWITRTDWHPAMRSEGDAFTLRWCVADGQLDQVNVERVPLNPA